MIWLNVLIVGVILVILYMLDMVVLWEVGMFLVLSIVFSWEIIIPYVLYVTIINFLIYDIPFYYRGIYYIVGYVFPIVLILSIAYKTIMRVKLFRVWAVDIIYLLCSLFVFSDPVYIFITIPYVVMYNLERLYIYNINHTKYTGGNK